MLKLLHKLLAKLLGRNLSFTPKSVVIDQINEPRPLPIGMKEFDDWSDRIISGALVPATVETQKATLAGMIMHLGPQESHKPDAFFIHGLRKLAANEIANAVFFRIQKQVKERLAKEEAEQAIREAVQAAEATVPLRVVANEPMED